LSVSYVQAGGTETRIAHVRVDAGPGPEDGPLKLDVPASSCSRWSPVIYLAVTMSVCRWPALLLPPGSQRRGDRPLDRVLEVIDRMHRTAGPLDHLGCHSAFHRPARMHCTPDAARDQQPRPETHTYSPSSV